VWPAFGETFTRTYSELSLEQNLAVLIDFENIAAGAEKEGLGRFDVEAVLERVKDKGRILIARSYADWGRFARFKQTLLMNNVSMLELTSHGMQDKNRADIAMVVDCLDLVYTRDYIDTFVIVSGDSDFTPLVLKIKELNKRVIGCGTRRSTSRLIINACDEFVFYDQIIKDKQRSRKRSSTRSLRASKTGGGSKAKAFDGLVEALEGLLREDARPPIASVLKGALLRRRPDFSESDLGYSSFTKFLESARDAGLIALERDRKAGGYRVHASDDAESVLEADEAPEKAAEWKDPYLPDGSDVFTGPLAGAGVDPLSSSTRKAVLDALVEAVTERNKRKRRVTIPFVLEDLRKKLRRTHGELSKAQLKGVLTALLKAQQLLHHKDGKPIRSQAAPFTLKKDALELNSSLTTFYLSRLSSLGADMTQVGLLADLFLGDAERGREIEETLAWMDAPAWEEDDVTEESKGSPAPAVDTLLEADDNKSETDPFDLDAILEADEAPEAPAAEPAAEEPAAEAPVEPELIELEEVAVEPIPEPEPAPEKPKRKRRTRKKKPEPAADAPEAAPAAPEAEAEEAPAKPKKKRVRRKKKPEPKAEPAAEAPEAEEAPAKPKRKRAVRKKKPEPVADDLLAALEPSDD